MRKILFTFLILSVLIFAQDPTIVTPSGTPPTPASGKYLICFCTSGGHASVHLFDGTTGNVYGRGLWANGFGTGKEAPALPHAGESAPPPSPGSSSSSSSSGSSGSSSGSSSSSSSSSSSIDSSSDSSTDSSGSSSGSRDFGLLNGPGSIRNDDGVAGKKCICYEITRAEYDSAVDFINKYERRYRLLSQNCMDFTADVAAHLGKEIPSSTDWSGASHPQTFYDSLNIQKKVWDQQNYTTKFIAYGSNESERFSKYVNASNPNRQFVRSQDADLFGYPEDLLNNPERVYRALVAKSELGPQTVAITVETDNQEYCGEQCVRIPQNQPATFRFAIPPTNNSITYWELGDGLRSIGSNLTYTFHKTENYSIRVKYFDERGAIYSGAYNVVVKPYKSACIQSTPVSRVKLMLLDGTEIKVDQGESYETADLNDPFLQKMAGLFGNDLLRLHFKRVDGSVIIGQAKFSDDRFENIRIFGVIDRQNELLFEQNPEIVIDCIRVRYNAALYLDEAEFEKLSPFDDSHQTLKLAWGKAVRYEGLDWWSSFKEMIFGYWISS